MGLFKRKKDIVDLGSLHKKREKRKEELKENFNSNSEITSSSDNLTSRNSNTSGLGFLGNMASASNNSDTQENLEKGYRDLSQASTNNLTSIERKRKLAKRLKQITENLETLSNQIYHLQQRMEVMEKKLNLNNF